MVANNGNAHDEHVDEQRQSGYTEYTDSGDAENGEATADVEIAPEDDVDESDVSPEAAQKIKHIKQKLAQCQKERQEYLDGWQRAQADVINARRAGAQAQTDAAKKALDGFVGELLRVLDSFDAAFADADAWARVDTQWRTGVEHIYTQLMQALADANVTAIEASAGEQFDPAQHEPVETVATASPEQDNTVAEQIQRGWQRNDTVIRPARVRVYQHRE